MRPIYLDLGEEARLFPLVAETSKESRACSVFLATMSAIPEFCAALLQTVGQSFGKRSKISVFTEVVFNGWNKPSDRPDGLIIVSGGKSEWRALIEAKVGTAQLDPKQIEKYLEIARNQKIDAVITISNAFATKPDHSPIKVSGKLTRTTKLFHWSWRSILTEAMLAKESVAQESVDQEFLLSEFIWFLENDLNSFRGFDQMPACWKEIIEAIQSGGPIRKSDELVSDVVSAWHEEVRDLSLVLSQDLEASVKVYLPRKLAKSPVDRRDHDIERLVDEKELRAQLSVPDAAAPLNVVVNMERRNIRVGMSVRAPLDKKRATARINWLLGQLETAEDPDLQVQVVAPKANRNPAPVSLTDLRQHYKEIVTEKNLQPPTGFEIFKILGDARRFAGRKTFIQQLEAAVSSFYAEVGQNLREWRPKPPRAKKAIELATEHGPETASDASINKEAF